MTKQRKGYSAVLIALVLTAFLGGCAEPSADQAYDTLEFYSSGTRAQIVQAIGSAQTYIDASLRDFADPAIVAALGTAASKGVAVRVLIDADFSASLNGISAQVSTNFGNSYGNLDSDFLIIDGMIYLLSSHNLASGEFLLFKMTDRDMLTSFKGEFDQMFNYNRSAWGSDVYGKKMPMNLVQNYYINDNWVEVYFQPVDNVIQHIKSRLGQTSLKIVAYFRVLDHSGIALLLNDVLNSCPGSQVSFSSTAIAKLTNYAFLLTNGGRVVTNNYDFNLIFADMDSEYQTLILTTFDLVDDSSLLMNDGTCLIITGPYVKTVYDAVAAKTASAVVSNVTITPPVLKSPVLFHDVVISEILWKGVKLSGALYDYGPCFIEIKNVTAQYINIGGYRIIITNKNVQSQPNMFSIPGGTILAPGGHYTIVSSTAVFSKYDYYWEWMFMRHDGFTMLLQDDGGNNIDRAADVNTAMSSYHGNTGIPMVRDLTLPIGDGGLTTEWTAAGTMKNYYPTYAAYGNLGTPGSD